MAVSNVRVRLNEAALAYVNQPGGIVSRRTDNVAGAIATLARVYSPKRTGDMVRAIDTSRGYARRTGCSFFVTIDVPYATFVLGGTTGPIYGNLRRNARGRFTGAGVDKRGRATSNRSLLPVGQSQGNTYAYARSVRGQDANDFLTQATREVMARYKR